MSIDKALSLWKLFSKLPFGKEVFSYLIRFINPYTGALGARVDLLEREHVEVVLSDKRANRNHLHSVHAIALANLGEFCSGLLVLSSLPKNARGIVTALSVQYLHKARGSLRAKCKSKIPEITEDTSLRVHTEIFNSADECVCVVDVTWQLGLINAQEIR